MEIRQILNGMFTSQYVSIVLLNDVKYANSPSSSSRRTGHKEEPKLYAQELPEKQ